MQKNVRPPKTPLVPAVHSSLDAMDRARYYALVSAGVPASVAQMVYKRVLGK